MKRSYVTCFPGARDHYQLAVALNEQDRLAAFATCFYWRRGLLGRMGASWLRGSAPLARRHAEGLDDTKVSCLELTNLAARLSRRVFQPSRVAVWEDGAFAREAVRLARSHQASLVLYEFQAEWAFRQPLRHDAVRILFQFHPHPDLEHPLLVADGVRYPQFAAGIRRNIRANLPARYRDHTRGAWRHADHVMVASHFTARSLVVAGCPEDRITVVPYGSDFGGAVSAPTAGPRPQAKPYFLWVGSGSHRKGLHHLLEAWSHCTLRSSHELVVIARTVDAELQPLLAAAPSVRHLPGVDRAELGRWFASATAFVLPSLSEGFGHVYLEALASGCPVIGTRHSMLPDFAAAQPHIRYVEPGEPDSLRVELERVGGWPASAPFFSTAAVRESVKAYTWERFRMGVEAVLARFDRS